MNRRTRAKKEVAVAVEDSGEAAQIDVASGPSKRSTRSKSTKSNEVVQKEASSTPAKRTTRRAASAANVETSEPKSTKRGVENASVEEPSTKRSRRGNTKTESSTNYKESGATKEVAKKKPTKKNEKVEPTTIKEQVSTTSRRVTRKNQSESEPEESKIVKPEDQRGKASTSVRSRKVVIEEPIKENSAPAEPIETKKSLRTKGKKTEPLNEPMEVDESQSIEESTSEVQLKVKSRGRVQAKSSDNKSVTENNKTSKLEVKTSKAKKTVSAKEKKEVEAEEKPVVSGRALRAQKRGTSLDVEIPKPKAVEKKRAPKKTQTTKKDADNKMENGEASTSKSTIQAETNSQDIKVNELLTSKLSADSADNTSANKSSGLVPDNTDSSGLNSLVNGSANVTDLPKVNGKPIPITVLREESESGMKRKPEIEELEPEKRARIEPSFGDLFTFGDPISNELGPRQIKFLDRKARKFEPALVKLSSKVRSVACGALHSVVITERGTIISFGVNDDKPLGRSTAREDNPDISDDSDCEDFDDKISGLPLSVKGLENVIKVTAGDMHSVALRNDGKAFIWGNFKDDSHKIGLFPDNQSTGSNYPATLLPRQIELEEKIIDIASGSHHVLLLTEKGQVYSFGEGSQGQLGRILSAELNTIGTARELFLKPQLVDIGDQIKRIFASQWCSFALTEDGVMYAWGLNNYHQLGFRSTSPIQTDDVLQVLKPEQVPCNTLKIEQVANGQQHTLFLDSEGSIYSCGSALYGKLGQGKEFVNSCGDAQAISYMKKIEQSHFGGEKVIEIACGDFCSMAITQSGKLYAWGQASDMIGSPDEDRFEPHLIGGPYAQLTKFITLSAGSAIAAVVGVLSTSSA